MSLDLTQFQNDDKAPLGPAPEGEYEIEFLKFKTDDDGGIVLYYGEDEDDQHPYIMPYFQVCNHPDMESFKDFNHFVRLPDNTMTPKERRQCLARLEEFGQAFGVDLFANRIDNDDMKGKTAGAILGIKDDEYGENNIIKQFIVMR